ncbi:MAG: hypothetical protein P0Y65_18435 [Candidatus Devosia phytovorans]|uniref:Uncharacterized protein n=1 Tax=Candidatus Devosia phytovorans TaxID=3121372 RepID=A0AAJ5VSR0_9HYPH|nr:hypothetical protein [Devosia sp.]WEK04136.1 MAG: hypothetical protein P0Y65_18435 [Devosia sp.]
MAELKPLLDFIAGPESGGNYNAYYGNSKNTAVNLTGMTLGDVQAFQAKLAKETGSSAAGRYQFIQGTLRGLMHQHKLSPNTLFTADLQDRLAVSLMEGRGLNSYLNGSISPEVFGSRLAIEWAGLPTLTGPKAGRSHYDGDAIGNKSGVGVSPFMNALLGVKGAALPTGGMPVQFGSPNPDYSNPTHAQTPGSWDGLHQSVMENPVVPNYSLNNTSAPAPTAPGPSFTEVAGAALSANWATLNLVPQLGGAAPVAGYNLSIKDELGDVPSRYHDRFIESRSPEQTQMIKTRVMRELDQMDTLNRAGWLGTAASIGAGLTDPVDIIAGLGIGAVSGGMGLPAVLARKFGKLAGVLEGAAIGASVTGVSQGILNVNRVTSEDAEFYAAMGMGLVLGGSVGALARNKSVASEAAMLRAAGDKVLGQGNEFLNVRTSNMGAASNTPRELIVADTADWLGLSHHMPKGFGVNMRYDLASSFHKTDNDAAGLIGLHMVEDGARFAEGTTPISAAEVKTMLSRTSDTRLLQAEKTSFEAWAKRKEIPLLERDRARHDFSEKVADYVENRNPHHVWEPEIKAYGDQFRSLMGDWQGMAQNPGVLDGTTRRSLPGFEKGERNQFYLPHIVDKGAVRHMINTYGTVPMGKFVGRAMMRANPELTEALAEQLGTKYVRGLDKLSAGSSAPGTRPISADNAEEIKRFLREESGMSDAEIDTIFDVANPTKARNGASPRGKKRALFDMDHKMEMRAQTGEVADVSIRDLFNRNVTELGLLYNQQMSGRVAMAQMRVKNPRWRGPDDDVPEFLVDGVVKDGEFDKLLQVIDDYGAEVGAKKTADTVEKLKASYDIILGRPRYNPQSKFNQTLRTLRDANYIRVMNMAGFAQIPELPQAISQIGVRAMFGNMPTFRDLWRNAKTGKLDTEIAQEIEDILGTGTEYLRGTTHKRFDDFDQPLEDFANSGFLGKVNDVQRGLKTATSIGSGMSTVNTMMQRWVGRGIFQKFANMAMKGDVKIDKRTMGLGLDQAMLDRVSSQIRKHAKFDGKRVSKMDWNNWDDRQAAAAFQMAAFRFGRQAVQENELGNMALWMSAPVAQTILQFRTFQMAGWAKQTMYGLNHLDGRMLAGWTTSMFTAAMVFVARSQLTSVGRSDREEWLEKRLTVDRIAFAGIQNGSWATLIPPAIDTVLTRFGQEGLFNTRTTDQPSDIWGGNPTVSFIDEFSRLPALAGKFAQGEATQADARKALSLVYFQNNLLVATLFSKLISGLPVR